MANTAGDGTRFSRQIRALFEAMAYGGDFGADAIRYFNGNLFNDALCWTWRPRRSKLFGKRRTSTGEQSIRRSWGRCLSGDWTPKTYATRRALYQSGRYRDPYRTRGYGAAAAGMGRGTDGRRDNANIATTPRGQTTGRPSVARVPGAPGQREVLDPACGSANFLYVTLQKLKDLEKRLSTSRSRRTSRRFCRR